MDNDFVKIGDLILGFYISGLINGFVHTDLHPGNFAWNNNKLIIYDFGLMLKLTKEETLQIIEIIDYILKDDLRNVINCFFKYFIDTSDMPIMESKTLSSKPNSVEFKNSKNFYKILDNEFNTFLNIFITIIIN